MTDTNITVIGNLTADPDLRYTAKGDAVASFTVASTPRVKVNGEWTDAEATFWRCSVWREAAENVTESLHKGTRVVVTGRVKSRSYEKDGAKRTSLEIDVEEIGPSLRYAIAKPEKSGARTSKPADQWGTSTDAPF